MADLSILVDQETSEARDVIFGKTLSVASQNARSTGLEDNPLHVTDQVPLPRLNPQPIPLADEPLKIADTVGNSFTSTDLSVLVPSDVSKARDVIFGAARFVASQNGLSAGLEENPLHLNETASDLWTGLTEIVRVSDSVSAQETLVEIIKLADTVTASIPFVGIQVQVSDEGIRLNDQSPFIEERLKVIDTVTAAIAGAAGDLSVTVGAENLKLADTVTVLENPLISAAPVESLKVQDTVQTSLTVLLATVADEPLKIADTVTLFENPLFATPADDNLKVQDTVIASTGGLIAVLADEVLHVQDTVSASLTVLLLTVTQESIKVQDTVTAQLDTLLVSLTESLKVQDTVTASSGGLIATPADENLKVQDTVSVSLTVLQLVVTTESMRVFDTDLTVTVTGAGQVNVSESLKVQDSVSAQLDTLLVTVGQEALKVQDTVTPALERSVVVTQESLKIADSVTASVGLSVVLADESLKVQDAVSGQLTVLRTSAAESLKIQDVLTLGVNLLSVVVVPEVLHIQDFVLTPAVADVTVQVRPDVEVIQIRQDVGSVLV